jgi:hypothetical protein
LGKSFHHPSYPRIGGLDLPVFLKFQWSIHLNALFRISPIPILPCTAAHVPIREMLSNGYQYEGAIQHAKFQPGTQANATSHLPRLCDYLRTLLQARQIWSSSAVLLVRLCVRLAASSLSAANAALLNGPKCIPTARI